MTKTPRFQPSAPSAIRHSRWADEVTPGQTEIDTGTPGNRWKNLGKYVGGRPTTVKRFGPRDTAVAGQGRFSRKAAKASEWRDREPPRE